MNEKRYYNTPPDPVAVARARRVAAAIGWRVEKSKQRHQHQSNRGLLMLLDGGGNLIAGARYDVSAKEIIAYCRNAERAKATDNELREIRKFLSRNGIHLMHRRNGKYWVMRGKPMTLDEVKNYFGLGVH